MKNFYNLKEPLICAVTGNPLKYPEKKRNRTQYFEQ